ncbi:MAG: RpiB/LacA/LacB family sugar-phosphate isomerase, partial [Lachnospiraceae bacterium]|nr:RpiB/LacA/LacB family sugar-phosphate isomerase [Lachnospiraceae bacterium]
LGGRVVGEGVALGIIDAFLNTEFSNGANHVRRIAKLS